MHAIQQGVGCVASSLKPYLDQQALHQLSISYPSNPQLSWGE